MPPKRNQGSITGINDIKKERSGKVEIPLTDLTRFCVKKIFEIGFVNRASEESEDDLNNIISTARKYEKIGKVSFITYEEVIDFMVNAVKNPENISLPEDIKGMLKDPCDKGLHQHENNLPIPVDVIAQLVKFKLIHTMYSQYKSQVNNMKDLKNLEEELEKLTKDLPTSQSDKKGKKEKGKKPPPKKEPPKKEKAKSTPSSEKVPEIDFTTVTLTQNPLILTSSFDDEIWFYCLSNFYDAHLLPALININVPISFITEVSRSKGEAEDEEESHIEINDTIENFWCTLNEILYGPSSHEELEGTILMKYTISNPQTEEGEGNHDEKKYLQELLDVLKSIHDLRLVHLKYIQNLKLCSLEHCGHKVCEYPNDFHVYKQLLSKFPVECINVPVIIESLLKEVHVKFEGGSITGSISCEEEDLYIKYDCDQTDEDYCLCPFSFDYFISKEKKISGGKSPVPKKEVLSEVNTSEETAPSSRDATFQIHENNKLEQILRSYKNIGRKVYDITLKHMKNMLPVMLLKKYNSDVTLDFKHSHDRPDAGCTVPELRDEEIFHFITSLLLFRLRCRRNLPSENEVCDVNMNLKMKEPIQDYREVLPDKLTEGKVQAYSKSLHKKAYYKNIYELRLIANYNWSEILPQAVLLQEIMDCNDEFSCMDYMYCDEVKSLLVRYHNDSDDFGVSTRIWDASLRTPVCFRDFCRYVCRDDITWMQKQESGVDTSGNSPSQQEDIDYKLIEPSSLVAAYNDYLEYLSSDCNIGSGMMKIHSSQEKLAKVLDYPRDSKDLKEYCLKSGEFYSFIAYELGVKRIEVAGATTVFKSFDGVKIKVDTTHFLGSEKTLSLVVSSDNNDLILHRNGDSFLLRFVASDETIVVINKPVPEYENCQPGDEIMEPSTGDLNTREKVSLESDRKEDEHTQSSSKLVKSASRTSSQKALESNLRLLHKERSSKTSHSKVFSSLQNLTALQRKNLFAKHFLNVRKSYSPVQTEDSQVDVFRNSLENDKIKATSNEILQAVMSSIENDISLDKINPKDGERLLCRKAENLKIPIFSIIKRLLYKHAKKEKCRKYVRKYVAKNIDSEQTPVSNNEKEFKVTLPNGLIVTIVRSTMYQDCTEVKQKYLTNTHPKDIEHESYRLFTRNGYILIRYPDGRIDILKSNGEIIQFEQPNNNAEGSVIDIKRGVEVKNCFKLPSCKNLHNFQKQIANYLVDKYGEDSGKFVSRRAHLHKQKASSQEFMEELAEGFELPYFKYSSLKFDGQRVELTKDLLTQKYECFMTHEFDHRLEERFYIRDDGMRCLLQRDQKLCVQFPDKSRITSWFDIEPELIHIDKKSGGWVSVVLDFKFEHPNYATVIYKASSDDFDIHFHNQLTIKKTGLFNFEINPNESLNTFLSEDTVQCRKTCCECKSVFECDIDIGKFSNSNLNKDKEILIARDSYNKVFRVHDVEKYSENENFIRGPLNYFKCDHYSKTINEKLYAIRNDYSGLLLWNNRNIETTVKQYEEDPKSEVVNSVNFFGFNCTEFLRKIHQPYNERFSDFDLTHNNLCLTRYQAAETKSPDLVCVSYREIYEFGSMEKLEYIIMEISDFIEESGKLSILPHELLDITTLMLQNINDREFTDMFELSSTTTEEIDDRPICDCLKLKFTYKEKIEYWKNQCAKYRKYIKTSFVPIYFYSEYYNETNKV